MFANDADKRGEGLLNRQSREQHRTGDNEGNGELNLPAGRRQHIKIMSQLCIPEKVLEQHAMTLGKTGSGKSSATRHIVEHLLQQKKRVCIVDPKGDWWGLKFAGAGEKRSPFNVIAFGDFKDAK